MFCHSNDPQANMLSDYMQKAERHTYQQTYLQSQFILKSVTTNRQAGRRRSGGRTVGIVPNENVNNLFVLLANIVHFSGICLSILYVYLFVCVFGCLVVHHRPAPTWFFTWSALTTSPTPTPVEQPTEAWAWAVAALVVALFSCIAVVVSF